MKFYEGMYNYTHSNGAGDTYGLGSGIRLRGGAFGTLADFPFFPAVNNTGIMHVAIHVHTYIHTYVCLLLEKFFRHAVQYEKNTTISNLICCKILLHNYVKLELCGYI